MKQNNWFDPFYIQSHLSEDELRIQENVREFCEKELKPNVIEMNRKNQFNIDLYPKFGDLGVLGQTLKTHGGSSTSNLAYGLVAYEFEKIDSSYRSSISVQSSLVIHPINEFGTENQKNKYLPELISGRKIGCFGLTESEAGSDPTSMKTTFKEVNDGYIILCVARAKTDCTIEIGVESHDKLYRNPFIDPLEPHELKSDIARKKDAKK